MRRSKPYHKADLRRVLIDAARDHIAAHGHLSLSLRALAAQAGVTTAAPYHHFADRRALLLAVAEEAYATLLTQSQAVTASALPPAEKLMVLGMNFLRFAEAQPRLMELMFESELTTPVIDPALSALQTQAYAAQIAVIAQALPHISSLEVSVRAMALWSLIYGYATLRAKLSMRPYDPTDVPTDQVDRAVLDRAVIAALAP
ncbi:TetR family transcriptional regulator [Novosphingobium sp. FSY-8]|uniref:TetR family transcriptional regulator n=1 Tax=Novosphingobium ovatum TaxID=1908523 RepID=A0ABW9XC80_9SPHN|nr:TetR/AcrR family transcriptional regulator [Novosphingobium ovatum]NBC36146.1 TetR family transcriptional regulator [Novosphingobium ovatum]